MEKNVASQKWIVFAFDRTDNTPKTGDAAQITANLRLDGGAANAVDDVNPAELEDGFYIFDITQAETNADLILMTPASSTGNIQVIGVPGAVYTSAPNSNALGIESDGDLTKVNLCDTNTDVRGTDSAATAASLATAQLDLDTITGVDGVNLLSATQTSIDAIETDTAAMQPLVAKIPLSDGTISWNATALGAINIQCDLALTDYDGPTDAEMIARTLVAASYFDPAADTVATVTTVTNQLTAVTIGNQVWDTDATDRQTLGTFGGAIGDPGANAETIYDAVVTDATGTNVAIDVIAIKADTGTTIPNHLTDIKGTAFVKDTHSLIDIETYVDVLDDGTSGNVKIASDVALVLVDTADMQPKIGTPVTDVSADIAVVVADTGELQTDWADGGRLDLLLDAIKVITDAIGATAAANLAKTLGTGGVVPFTVDTVVNTHTPTVTEFQADDVTEGTPDHYNGRVIIWLTGSLAGQATDITDYVAVGGIGQFTVTALTEPPSNNDTGIIV